MQTTTKPKTINRRTAIKAGAAIGAMGVVPAAANADAALIDMWGQRQKALKEADSLEAAMGRLEERHPSLKMVPTVTVPHNTARSIAEWEADPSLTQEVESIDYIKAMFDAHDTVDCHKPLKAYRAALIAELEGKKKVRGDLAVKTGYKAMADRVEAAEIRRWELDQKIMETPAHTPHGLLIKIRVADMHGYPITEADDEFEVRDRFRKHVVPDAERILGASA